MSKILHLREDVLFSQCHTLDFVSPTKGNTSTSSGIYGLELCLITMSQTYQSRKQLRFCYQHHRYERLQYSLPNLDLALRYKTGIYYGNQLQYCSIFASMQSGDQQTTGTTMLLKPEKEKCMSSSLLPHASKMKNMQPQLGRKYTRERLDTKNHITKQITYMTSSHI